MGGYITLRNMVVNKDIKSGVIWAGVVASYPDLLNNWRRRNPNPGASPSMLPGNTNGRGWRNQLVAEFGEPESNPEFWNSISSNAYLNEISGPVQIHHGTADEEVPFALGERLKFYLDQAGKSHEFYAYQGGNHDIGDPHFSVAMNRTIEFFKKNL